MKTAVIVYGTYCNLKFAVPTWTFLNDLDCDVYVSTWKTSRRDSLIQQKSIKYVVTDTMITDFLNPKQFAILDENLYEFKSKNNNIEKCIVHWNNCIDMIQNSGIAYDSIMLQRIDNYHNKFDNNIFFNINKSDRIYGLDEIHLDKNGIDNINPHFFFGNFQNMVKFLTNFPCDNTSLHEMIPKKLKSIGLFVEQIKNLNITLVRPNFDELTEEDLKNYTNVLNKSFEW